MTSRQNPRLYRGSFERRSGVVNRAGAFQCCKARRSCGSMGRTTIFGPILQENTRSLIGVVDHQLHVAQADSHGLAPPSSFHANKRQAGRVVA